MSRRAATGSLIGERCRKHRFVRIPELVRQVIRNGAVRRKAIGIVAEAGRIGALELDREIGGAAIVLCGETVGFAASCAANSDYVEEWRKAVDHRLACRTSSAVGQDEHPPHPDLRERLMPVSAPSHTP